jgi:hypothetical protein
MTAGVISMNNIARNGREEGARRDRYDLLAHVAIGGHRTLAVA